MEAAQIDGANRTQRFWSITIPRIFPVIVVSTLFSVVQTFAEDVAALRVFFGWGSKKRPRPGDLRLGRGRLVVPGYSSELALMYVIRSSTCAKARAVTVSAPP